VDEENISFSLLICSIIFWCGKDTRVSAFSSIIRWEYFGVCARNNECVIIMCYVVGFVVGFMGVRSRKMRWFILYINGRFLGGF